MIKDILTTGLLITLGATTAYADKISIGFGQDKPPFVSPDCSDGLEVRLAQELFSRAGYEFDANCMTNKRLVDSYSTGRIDAGVTVPDNVDGMHYTGAFSGFENFAISRTSDGLEVNSVGDLAGKSAIAWNNAAAVLGDEFAAVTGDNPDYEEAKSQVAQVKKFLNGRVDIVIIDKNIFRWLTKELIESGEVSGVETEFTYHPIFPGTLDYYIGFTDEEMRDQVDAALTAMREDGTYQQILDSYLSL